MTEDTFDPALKNYSDNFGQEYAAQMTTLGQTLASVLQFFGCRRIHGIGGDFVANLINALQAEIHVAAASNEMHAGFVACGQAEVEGMGFCFSTYTVGSLPMMSAAALARAENLPVVFISGCPGESEIDGTALHHAVISSHQWSYNFDAALHAYRGLGMRAERLQGERDPHQPNIAGEHFYELVAHAYRNREPVFIEVPRDLVNLPTQAIHLPATLVEVNQQTLRLDGANLIARQIQDKLAAAKYPLLYFGARFKLNKPLLSLIAHFCREHNIPYASSWFAKGLLDESDALSLGNYNGVYSSEHHRAYIENKVDYVIEIGTSITPRDTTISHYLNKFGNKTLVKGSCRDQADLMTLFSHLLEAELPRFEYQPPPANEPQAVAADQLDYHNLADALNQLQREHSPPFIYLPEVGSAFFASYSLVCEASSIGRSWLSNPWYAAMGTSIPYARAVCQHLQEHAAPDVPIVLMGDGGFQFQHNELIHFLKEDLFAVIIYMRNDIFSLGKAGEAPVYHPTDAGFDLGKIIEAYGGAHHLCESVGQLNDTMRKLVALRQGLHLIEVPSSQKERYQCRELRLLNLFIRRNNGDPEAIAEWDALQSSAT